MPGSDPYERVLKAVDDVRDEMVDFLRQLVRIDTAVPPGNNYPECAELLRAMMARLGYEAQLVQVPGCDLTDRFFGIEFSIKKVYPPCCPAGQTLGGG